jgi:hypothetical protein
MPSTESPDAIIEEFLLRLERDGLAAVVAVDVNPAEGLGEGFYLRAAKSIKPPSKSGVVVPQRACCS